MEQRLCSMQGLSGTVEEWQQIAEPLGAKALVGFIFPDGKEI
ncbi:hypothetical protein [Acutalibacter intestini]|nr:hypothetical protein [Acutalibacter sp. M00204]